MEQEKLGIVINSGLGNQLFTLFAGMSKALDENKTIVIYPENNNRVYYFNNFLKVLNKYVSYDDDVDFCDIYNEPYFYYTKIQNNAKIIKGFYQSYKYFNNNFDKIVDILKIRQMQEKNKLLFKSIAIHFRFGDYLTLTDNHIILPTSYYLNAINELSAKINISEYTFIIFSEKCNDVIIDKYIKILNLPIKFVKIYEIMPTITDYEEFLYMSNCDHFIIANSTFSWWSAYLSTNPDKIVLYPSLWFGPKLKHYITTDLFPDKWSKIKC